MLQQAATVSAGTDVSYEMLDYVVSLREGIMDAWGGIIIALKAGNKGLSLSWDCCALTDETQLNFSPRTSSPFSNYSA